MKRVSRLRILVYTVLGVELAFVAREPFLLLEVLFTLLMLALYALPGIILFLFFRLSQRSRVFTAPHANGPFGAELQAEPDGLPPSTKPPARTGHPLLVAVALIIFGAVSFLGMMRWYFTPVDMPVTLAEGAIRTREFRVFAEDEYAIRVLVDSTDENDPACPVSPNWKYHSVLNARWIAFQDGQPYASNTFGYGSYSYNANLFDAPPGEYRIEVQVLADASCLDKWHPRLVVEPYSYSAHDWSFLLRMGALLCCASGAIITGALIFDWRRRTRVTVGLAGDEIVGPVIRQPNRHRPLRNKFGGLPHFGMFATLALFVIWVPVMIFTSWSFYTPRGLWVRVSATDYLRATANRSVGPLVVTIERDKKTVRYRINGEIVPIESFREALKHDLSRRADWVVFVDGDRDLPVQNVVQIIDIAHSLQAKSVMLTPGMKHEVTGK